MDLPRLGFFSFSFACYIIELNWDLLYSGEQLSSILVNTMTLIHWVLIWKNFANLTWQINSFDLSTSNASWNLVIVTAWYLYLDWNIRIIYCKWMFVQTMSSNLVPFSGLQSAFILGNQCILDTLLCVCVIFYGSILFAWAVVPSVIIDYQLTRVSCIL